MTEETPAQPIDPYGISKFAVEMELSNAREMFGLNSIIFRPHNVYGPRQDTGDPHRHVNGIFMKQASLGDSLTVVGDGRQVRAFSYISNVAPVIAQSVNHPSAYNQIFNIGADQSYTVLQAARLVCKTMDVKCDLRFTPARHEAMELYCSHEKARAFFGPLMTEVTLENGLREMAEWLKGIGVRRPVKPPPREISAQRLERATPALEMANLV
jgi:UDP-glucose 4-epimerase